MQGAPKYNKIEIKWRTGITDTFEDCGMVLTADKIILVTDSIDSVENLHKTQGLVFELSDMESYATYKK